jgi:hypothetical protein
VEVLAGGHLLGPDIVHSDLASAVVCSPSFEHSCLVAADRRRIDLANCDGYCSLLDLSSYFLPLPGQGKLMVVDLVSVRMVCVAHRKLLETTG